MRRLVLLIVVLVAAGGWALAQDPALPSSAAPTSPAGPQEDPATSQAERAASPPLRRSSCPAGLPSCRSVRGRVVLVESVDPDGDGDLHVVLAGGGVTGPGITSVDVSPDLRPRRDPRIGDQVSTAGQVQRGSFGQSQVHALEFHVRRR